MEYLKYDETVQSIPYMHQLVNLKDNKNDPTIVNGNVEITPFRIANKCRCPAIFALLA